QTEELRSVTDATLEYADTCAVVRLTRLAPHIKYLCIRLGRDFTVPDVLLEEMALPELETLKLYGTSISHTLLLEFLKRAPKLRTLEIDQCEVVGDVATWLELPHLERLDIGQCSIGTALLGTILAAAPNLREMRLTYCENTTGMFTDECAHRLQLHALETLGLQNLPLSSSLLFQILIKAPNLQELRLDMLKIIEPVEEIDFSLKALRKVAISKCGFHTTLFETLLLCAPHIQELDVRETGCVGSMSRLLFKKPMLSSLKTLNFHTCNLSMLLFEQILLAASNIKKINMRYCQELSRDFDFERFRESDSCCKLELLHVWGSPIPLKVLLAIIEKAEQLQKLEIKFCSQIGSPFDYNAYNLPSLTQLKSIECQYSAITVPFLQLLLSHAPNIQELSISNCQGSLGGSFHSVVAARFSFFNLQRLTFYTPSTTPLLPLHILKGAPNIEYIEIDNSDILADACFDDMAFARLKSLTADCGNASLVQFLQKAPNLGRLELPHGRSLSGPITRHQLDQITLEHLQKVDCYWLSQELKNRMIECSPNVQIVVRDAPKQAKHQQTVPSSTYQVDTSTGPSSTTFHVTRIFESKDGTQPQVRDYRLRVYDSLRFGRNPPFEWYNEEEITLTTCKNPPVFTTTKEEFDAAWDRVRAPGHTFYLATYDMPCSDFLPSY
ncbi:MAG: hypothetical protein JSR46_07810, partial [Verrucomicrobia bacterium]|nr:hypothetical protein [Verrucomicrobiota bacterium]